MSLTIKQKSILWSFVESALELGPKKINQLCRITLSSRFNVGEEFPFIIEGFMDCNAAQIIEQSEKLKKKIR